jgi:hypothetical protein
MRKLFAVMLLTVAFAGCGSDNDETPPASTPAAAEVEAEAAHDLEGYSEGVKRHYGGAHEHDESDPSAAIEAEYHQPPKPAEAAVGEPITLTATNIGVRLAVTVTKVDTVGEHTAVHLKLESTGITIFESEFNSATLTSGDGKPVPVDADASAKCSNGLDEIVRIEVGSTLEGCVLFPKGEGDPTRFQLALEQVPTEAGGIWNLG